MNPDDYEIIWYGVLDSTRIYGMYRSKSLYKQQSIVFWGICGKPLFFKIIKNKRKHNFRRIVREKLYLGYREKDTVDNNIQSQFFQFLTFATLSQDS